MNCVTLLCEQSNRMESSAQYQLLYLRLKKEILADVYPIGSILPSENDLCTAANLSRSTVRQALSQLETEGYITKQKGKGSIVKSKSRSLNLLSFHGFSAMVDKTKMSTLSVQEPSYTSWPEDFHFELSELEKAAACIHFARVRAVEERPVMYELTFVPNLNLPHFVRRFKLNQSFFEFLAKEYQLEISGMEQQIWAVAAPPFVAQHLRVELNSPVLKINRKYHSNRSHLNLYSILYCNTEKYALGNTSGVLNQSI